MSGGELLCIRCRGEEEPDPPSRDGRTVVRSQRVSEPVWSSWSSWSSWSRVGRVVAGVLGVVVVLLVVAQIVLPSVATSRLRSQLSRHGHVVSVSVSAFPAIELLWGQAGSVNLTMTDYGPSSAGAGGAGSGSGSGSGAAAGSGAGGASLSPQQKLINLLAKTANAGSVTAHIGTFRTGKLVLENVVFTKRGSALAAQALLTSAALTAALPGSFSLRPLTSSAGELKFRGSTTVLGHRISLDARLVARHGDVVIQPDLIGFFPSFASLKIFHDPQVDVESVSSRAVSGGWELTATAEFSSS
jgi:hypothetical protein